MVPVDSCCESGSYSLYIDGHGDLTVPRLTTGAGIQRIGILVLTDSGSTTGGLLDCRLNPASGFRVHCHPSRMCGKCTYMRSARTSYRGHLTNSHVRFSCSAPFNKHEKALGRPH